MLSHPWFPAALASVVLAACSPAFNWREVRMDDASLVALLPCKPDKGVRTLPLAGAATMLRMQGCEAGGMMFTLAAAQVVPPTTDVSALLGHWKTALMANVQAAGAQDRNFVPPGARPLPASVLASFSGKRPDGSPVVAQVAFFAQGDQIYQAAIFSDRPAGEVAETFFSSLGLR